MRKTLLAASVIFTVLLGLTNFPNTTEAKYLEDGTRYWSNSECLNNTECTTSIQSIHFATDDYRDQAYYRWDYLIGSDEYPLLNKHTTEGTEATSRPKRNSGSLDFYEDENVIIIPD